MMALMVSVNVDLSVLVALYNFCICSCNCGSLTLIDEIVKFWCWKTYRLLLYLMVSSPFLQESMIVSGHNFSLMNWHWVSSNVSSSSMATILARSSIFVQLLILSAMWGYCAMLICVIVAISPLVVIVRVIGLSCLVSLMVGEVMIHSMIRFSSLSSLLLSLNDLCWRIFVTFCSDEERGSSFISTCVFSPLRRFVCWSISWLFAIV